MGGPLINIQPLSVSKHTQTPETLYNHLCSRARARLRTDWLALIAFFQHQISTRHFLHLLLLYLEQKGQRSTKVKMRVRVNSREAPEAINLHTFHQPFVTIQRSTHTSLTTRIQGDKLAAWRARVSQFHTQFPKKVGP